METKHIAIPISEIRKKLFSLGISEEQYKEFLINKYENSDIQEVMLENGTIFKSTREDVLAGIDMEVKQIFHPTEEDLQREEKYVNKLVEEGFDLDFQEYFDSLQDFV